MGLQFERWELRVQATGEDSRPRRRDLHGAVWKSSSYQIRERKSIYCIPTSRGSNLRPRFRLRYRFRFGFGFIGVWGFECGVHQCWRLAKIWLLIKYPKLMLSEGTNLCPYGLPIVGSYRLFAYGSFTRYFCSPILSRRMYSLNSFRKSTPPQNRQLNILISKCKR